MNMIFVYQKILILHLKTFISQESFYQSPNQHKWENKFWKYNIRPTLKQSALILIYIFFFFYRSEKMVVDEKTYWQVKTKV